MVVVFLVLMMMAALASCGSGKTWTGGVTEEGEDGLAPASGEFVTGTEVELARVAVPVSGGIVEVDKPGNPLDGMTIEVAEGTYTEDRTFVVCSADIISQSFGDALDPVTPLVTVDDGGGDARKDLLVSVPMQMGQEEFVEGFLYDGVTGWLEGMPTVELTGTHVVSVVPHFSSMVWAKAGVQDLEDKAHSGISSGFLPGRDDWEFPNEASIVYPGSQAYAQATTEHWYYMMKKTRERAQPLYGLYDNNGGDKTPQLWQDDSRGYRFVSVVSTDLEKVLPTFWKGKTSDKEKWHGLAMAINVTHAPQLIFMLSQKTEDNYGIVLLAYKLESNRLYVADPNYPGDTNRYIEYVDSAFKPYVSGSTASAARKEPASYEGLLVFSNPLLDPAVSKVRERWIALENEVIGVGTFPGYSLKVYDDSLKKEVDLVNDYQAKGDKLQITAKAEDESKWGKLAVRIYRDGAWLELDDQGKIKLKEGENHLGIWVTGGSGANKGKYADFKWVTIKPSDKNLKKQVDYYSGTNQIEAEYWYYEKNGVKVFQGSFIRYFSNGNIEQNWNYVDGVRQGPQEERWDNGNPHTTYSVKDDKLDGTVKEYDYQGRLWRESEYRNGELVPGSEKIYGTGS